MATTIKGSALDASEIAGDLGIGGTPVTGAAGSKTAHIKGTSAGAYMRLTTDTSGHTASDGLDIILGGGVNPDAYIWNRESGPLKFGTNNTEQMQIDSAGRVTTPNQPAFRAYTNYSAHTKLTHSKPYFSVISHNIGGHFGVGTQRFTAPVSGTYLFSVHTLMEQPSGYSSIELKKNGGRVSVCHSPSSGVTSYFPLELTEEVYLTIGDYVEVYGHNSASTGGWYGTANYNSFSGHLIG